MSETQPPVTNTTPSPSRRRRRLFVIGPLLILIAAAGGLVWWLYARQYESTDDAFIDTHMAQIAPQVSGRVLHVPVDDNQDIKAGDILVEIDPADYQAKLDIALANQASKSSALTQAQAEEAAAVINVQEADAQIAAAEANAQNASTQFTRNQLLAQKQIISRQQLDDSTANTKTNNANLDAAKRKKDTYEALVKVAQSQATTAEADVKSADAEVEQARLNLSYTKIIAAQDGRVTGKSLSEGDYLQAGQHVMTLVPHLVWVTANYKETQLDHIRPGQKAEIIVDAFPEHPFHGHVDSIESGGGAAFSLLPPENATGNYIKIVQRVPIKIVFDDAIDPAYHLGPGMSVVPTITIQ